MKRPLWILNSSLLILFILTLFLNIFLKQDIPVFRPIKVKKTEEVTIEKKINLEKIYKKDIFGTYSPVTKPEPNKKDLITPIPEYEPHQIIQPPEPKKQTFIEPLNITIKGIISASNEEKSVTMAQDETNKEKIYHLGDMIKDGQVIKINRNKVILLRANGQQEIYFLREEPKIDNSIDKEWKYTIKKTDDQNYIVDPKRFSQKIESLGEILDKLSLIPAYEKGTILGIKIGKLENEELSSIVGLQANDIILSIDDLMISSTKNRIKIFDKIVDSKNGDSIKLSLRRNYENLDINYKLEKIAKPIKRMFVEPATENGQNQATTELKMSREQQREQQVREFNKQHQTPKQQNIISDIRKRILESMKSRSLNRRIR